MRVALALALALTACAPAPPGARRQAIIGGVRDTGDPSVVLLVSYPPDRTTYLTCTASVIAPRVLVTAAHCVDAPNHPDHTFGVFTGDDASAFATVAELAPQLLAIDAVHAHPDYDPAPPFVADIGVAITHDPLPLATLPIGRDPLPLTLPGQPARIVGYGQTQYQKFNAKKYAAATSVTALPDDDTVVVGDAARHSCLGDSGGPALVELGGQETIIGVDSYTDSSGCTMPAHYRRTDHYLPFLDAYAPPPAGADLGRPADLAMVDAAPAGADAGDVAREPAGCAFAGGAAPTSGALVSLFPLGALLAQRRRAASASSRKCSTSGPHSSML